MRRIALLVMFSTALISAQQRKEQPQPPQGHVGRYQIVLYQGELPPRLNTYLLDTETGRTWMMKALPDGNDVWEPIYKVDSDEEEAALARKHQKRIDFSQAPK